MCLKYRACAENLASRNSLPDLPDPADPADPAETGPAEQNRPYVPRAGGQDDGSLHKLPQIIHIPPPSPLFFLEMSPKSSQGEPTNDSKMIPNWTQHDPKVTQKWKQKWSQDDPKLIPPQKNNNNESDPNVVTRWSKNDRNMIPKWS